MSKCLSMYECHYLRLPVVVVSVLAGIFGSNVRAADASTTPPAIVLTSPLDYQVFQREDRSKGTATIAGRLPIDAKARFRWRGKSIAGEVPEQWNELPVTAGTHAFSFKVTVPAGGWYRLELQAYSGSIVLAQAQVAHVGMGEVFVVSGQSNSTNYGAERLVPETGLVASFDGHAWGLAKDPQGGCDGSGGGSFIPPFGDALAKKYHVPIGVASTGQGATSVRQWLPQGARVKQQPTTGGMKPVGPGEWESDGVLFNRLVQRFAVLGPKGFRAVLWHQGESDAGQARAGYPADRQITGEQYFDFMGILIRAAQEKAGWPVPWFTAQTTYHVGDPSDAEFRAAMKKLWDKGVSLEGPDTDTLGEVYRSGVHFNGKGQRAHGLLWAEKVGTYLDRELAKPAQSPHAPTQPIKFEPTLESLKQYAVPEWFRDAKLGIWAVWGPESVPMQGDWYAHRLYDPNDAANKFHLAHYGHPSKVGFKDVIPLWKAERWAPDRLMTIYKKAGARYFCMIAEHHDNFDCWNSKFQKWNSVNLGPKRDIAGDWQRAATKLGLRFGMTEHLAASWWFYATAKGADTSGPLAGVPYDGADPRYASLYWTDNLRAKGYYDPTAPDAVKRVWFQRIHDMIDRYHPDLLYSDSPLPYPETYGRNLLAHFYNDNIRQHDGRLEAVYNCKEDSHGRWVQDLERGVMDGISPYPWQTDTCVGGWYYDLNLARNHGYKSTTTVLQMLADIVSKNGNLLLNFPPRPDGTLDKDELKILDEMAAWMPVNGEAIFGTRPWKVFGEGARKLKSGMFNENNLRYTASDIRFTMRGPVLYALALGWPENGTLLVHSLATGAGKIDSVALLGSSEPLAWSQRDDGLVVTLPKKKPCEHVYALKIRGRDLEPGPLPPPPPIEASADGQISLKAVDADIHGESPRYEQDGAKDQSLQRK